MRHVTVDGLTRLVDDVSAAVLVEDGRGRYAEEDGSPFDPANHTVEEVLEYLASAPDDEAARVLKAEESGKARKGVLDA